VYDTARPLRGIYIVPEDAQGPRTQSIYQSQSGRRAHALRLWYTTLPDDTRHIQWYLEVGTRARQASSCCKKMDRFMHERVSQQISLAKAERYRLSYCLIGWKTGSACLSTGIVEGARGKWQHWQERPHRDAGELDTCAASLRHLMLLPVALSCLRLASFLDTATVFSAD
jgi:hypothetical protein